MYACGIMNMAFYQYFLILLQFYANNGEITLRNPFRPVNHTYSTVFRDFSHVVMDRLLYFRINFFFIKLIDRALGFQHATDAFYFFDDIWNSIMNGSKEGWHSDWSVDDDKNVLIHYFIFD
jgi:hypothetical protein